MYCTPGPLNSILINTENAVPNNPENRAKIKYNVPLEMESASQQNPLKDPYVPIARHTAQPSANSLFLIEVGGRFRFGPLPTIYL